MMLTMLRKMVLNRVNIASRTVPISLLTMAHCRVQLIGGATEAKSSMFKLATDVSSWWSNLDPGVPKPTQPSSSSATRTASDAQQVLSPAL